jgi:3-oxoacyl-[acyl-carrier protein] reductase
VKDSVVAITGASKGIGAELARQLAAKGSKLVLAARSEKELEDVAAGCKKLGASVVTVKADVTSERDCQAIIAGALVAFGRLDALVNNAGTTSNVRPGDFEAMTAEEWDRVFAVNVRGMFQVTRAAAPFLKAACGSVVNTASIVGLRPGPQPLPYAASKAAVVSLTKLLALNLAPDVRVNAVAPGWMEGDWMKRMLADRYDDLMARRAKSTPLRRCATAEDVAEVIVNLITGSRFVNGEIIVIDGGYAATT